MATNQQSLVRQWHMLRMVPRAPAKISAKELCERLCGADFLVTKRTVERDLKELSTVFPIMVDSRDKLFGWSWLRDASSFDLPGLTVPEALTLTLVEQHLRHHLPPITVDALRPHFRSAARTLASVDDSAPSRAWLDKVRSVPPHLPLLPPRMDQECQRNAYVVLMQDRQLKLHYRKRDSDTPTVYASVHPLAWSSAAARSIWSVCSTATTTCGPSHCTGSSKPRCCTRSHARNLDSTSTRISRLANSACSRASR